MNITAMIGAAMITERPIERRASRVSPANTATYSNPDSAPTASFPKMFTFSSVKAGRVMASGWYARSVPRNMLMTGSRIRNAKAIMSSTLPALCTHLLIESPRMAMTMSVPRTTPVTAPM